jgi:hypothetical protein
VKYQGGPKNGLHRYPLLRPLLGRILIRESFASPPGQGHTVNQHDIPISHTCFNHLGGRWFPAIDIRHLDEQFNLELFVDWGQGKIPHD